MPWSFFGGTGIRHTNALQAYFGFSRAADQTALVPRVCPSDAAVYRQHTRDTIQTAVLHDRSMKLNHNTPSGGQGLGGLGAAAARLRSHLLHQEV